MTSNNPINITNNHVNQLEKNGQGALFSSNIIWRVAHVVSDPVQ